MELIKRIQKGDESALEIIITEYHSYVFKIVYSILGSYSHKVDLQGIVNQVFFTLWQNTYTDEGDFLVWMNIDTIEWYHTQFVQSKDMMGEAYCTQHTPNYFNVNFNSRVDSTTFDTNHVYIVDMAS